MEEKEKDDLSTAWQFLIPLVQHTVSIGSSAQIDTFATTLSTFHFDQLSDKDDNHPINNDSMYLSQLHGKLIPLVKHFQLGSNFKSLRQ
jgi:hypothetical protein